MLELLKNCKMVVTDSGGLQKEAFFNKKHCIIAREETEWIELVEHGFAKIVGSDKDQILAAFGEFGETSKDFSIELYGNNVGEKIHQSIKELIQ
jgi:UDP-GlcNAc3NAcA epimerase